MKIFFQNLKFRIQILGYRITLKLVFKKKFEYQIYKNLGSKNNKIFGSDIICLHKIYKFFKILLI